MSENNTFKDLPELEEENYDERRFYIGGRITSFTLNSNINESLDNFDLDISDSDNSDEDSENTLYIKKIRNEYSIEIKKKIKILYKTIRNYFYREKIIVDKIKDLIYEGNIEEDIKKIMINDFFKRTKIEDKYKFIFIKDLKKIYKYLIMLGSKLIEMENMDESFKKLKINDLYGELFINEEMQEYEQKNYYMYYEDGYFGGMSYDKCPIYKFLVKFNEYKIEECFFKTEKYERLEKLNTVD